MVLSLLFAISHPSPKMVCRLLLIKVAEFADMSVTMYVLIPLNILTMLFCIEYSIKYISIYMGKLESELKPEIDILTKYFDTQTSDGKTTSHYYETSANNFIKNSIKKIRCSTALYNSIWTDGLCVAHVIEMNEMYSSRLCGVEGDAGSDAVFQTNHIDGPFGFVPYFTLIRCIVTIYNETAIKTNLNGVVEVCGAGDFLAHDYNRDLHYIFGKQGADEKRYVLKIHYVLYPVWMPMFCVDVYKYCNVGWNSMARSLFRFALNPKTPVEVFINWGINTATFLAAWIAWILFAISSVSFLELGQSCANYIEHIEQRYG
jgi:hypothetical protein